jgi:quercetin dioxygenase-like cupin family protein
MTAGQTVTGPAGQRIVLAEIGQTVMLDNDRVKVWDVTLAPGESQPWHLHHNPYLVINLEASPGRMDWLDGAPSRYLQEYVGGVVFRPTSPVHMLTNVGTTRYRNRLVELKDIGEDAVGDVVPALVPRPARPAEIVIGPEGEEIKLGPVGQHIVFETDLVRVWETVLDPGVRLPWHRHQGPHVELALEPAQIRIERLDGAPAESVNTGVDAVAYREPGAVQSVVNAGTTRYRNRLIELKYLGENR